MPKTRKPAAGVDDKLSASDKGISKTIYPYSCLIGDNRVLSIISLHKGEKLEFRCKCGTAIPQEILPTLHAIHPKFKCGDCLTYARCLVCNNRAKAPRALPPFETREAELAMYYCREHMGCAASDPNWEKFDVPCVKSS